MQCKVILFMYIGSRWGGGGGGNNFYLLPAGYMLYLSKVT